MDLSRARIFIFKNKITGDQIDEFYNILKDLQADAYDTCENIITRKQS